jgi:hypothetical protein
MVVASEFSSEALKSLGLVFRLERPADPRDPWKAVEIDRLPTSHRFRVANGVYVNAPLTAPDARGPEYRGHVPLVFYQPGEWTRRLITDADEGVMHGIYVVDFDGDGQDEILTASFLGIHLLDRGKDGQWKRTKLASGSPLEWPKSGSSDVTAGHLGKQWFLASIDPWHGNQVASYTKTGGQWRREVIEETFVEGHTILAADFDHDGNDEIVAGCRGAGGQVNLYLRRGKAWVKQPLETGTMAAASCAVADFNADGRPDLACIGSASANLKWYENVTPAARR